MVLATLHPAYAPSSIPSVELVLYRPPGFISAPKHQRSERTAHSDNPILVLTVTAALTLLGITAWALATVQELRQPK